MNNWNRSDVIALSSLIVSIVAIIIGVAIPEVRCFVGLQSESCPSLQTTPTSPSEPNQNDQQPKSSPPICTVEPGTNLISKATEVNYTQLRDLLAAGKWKEADRETYRLMTQTVGKEEEQRLDEKDLENFPCEDLRTINQLWLSNSQGKFGFSVQKEIYESLGGTREYNEEVWKDFCDRIGWRKGGKWLDYSELTFNQNAPQAHLPTGLPHHRRGGMVILITGWNKISLVQMTVDVNIEHGFSDFR